MGKVFASAPKIEPIVYDTSAQDKATAEAKAKEEALARQRRGMDSVIHTSYTGISDNNDGLRRKKLLGE